MTTDPKPRDTTISAHVPPALQEQVQAAAKARGWTTTVLVRRAVEDYLDRLVPADEIVWTRDPKAGE